MATSSLLGIDSDNLPATHNATGIDSLGPSDASDSGSDSAGAYSAEPDSDTDRFGTGERSSVQADEPADARDILPDHIENYAPDDGADDAAVARASKPLVPDDFPADAEAELGEEADEEGSSERR